MPVPAAKVAPQRGGDASSPAFSISAFQHFSVSPSWPSAKTFSFLAGGVQRHAGSRGRESAQTDSAAALGRPLVVLFQVSGFPVSLAAGG